MGTETYGNRQSASDVRTLVFAGTAEGHGLAEYFSRKGRLDRVDFCVATEYGAETISDIRGVSVLEGRLDKREMEQLIREGRYALVIDATHPYAAVVTQNIKEACQDAGAEYIRLLREEGDFCREGVRMAGSIEEAVAVLNEDDDRVLLTTGAKELHRYSDLRNIGERAVARVLPSAESIAACQSAGIPPKHIVCMQGPFSREMNLATLRQYGCGWIVTKNTGKAGGFEDKVALCQAGYKVIVIGRPTAEKGISYEKVLERLEKIYG